MTFDEVKDRYLNKRSGNKRTAAEIALLQEGVIDDDDDDSMDEPRKKRRKINRKTKQTTIMEQFQPSDLTGINTIDELFDEKEFCILNCYPSNTDIKTDISNDDTFMVMDINNNNNESKNDENIKLTKLNKYNINKNMLEKLIHSHSGIITQNPLVSTNYIIASKKTPKVENMITMNVHNIIKPDWIFDCIKEDRIINFAPHHLIYSNIETQQTIKKDYDIYGDHFTKNTTVDILKDCFNKIELKHQNNSINNNNIIYNSNNIWLKPEWMIDDYDQMILETDYNLFRSCHIYVNFFDDYIRDNIQMKIRLYGGIILNKITFECTHIIVDKHNFKNINKINDKIRTMMNSNKYKYRPHIITQNWIFDSIKSKQGLLDCKLYQPFVQTFQKL